jgi:hydrogenase maturation protease
MSRILIAGVGNVFFKDDGFGVEVCRRLATESLGEGVVVKDFGIRGVHLAYELESVTDLLIVIDAIRRGDAPGTIAVIEPSFGAPSLDDEVAGAHGMHLPAVVAAARALGRIPPRVVLVGCEPADIEEGMGLSPEVLGAVDVAIDEVRALVSRADPSLCLANDRCAKGSDP